MQGVIEHQAQVEHGKNTTEDDTQRRATELTTNLGNAHNAGLQIAATILAEKTSLELENPVPNRRLGGSIGGRFQSQEGKALGQLKETHTNGGSHQDQAHLPKQTRLCVGNHLIKQMPN